MKILDLTHMIEAGMPVYPGTEAPEIIEANTLEKDGFREKLISMYSHTGTHMDAPGHILEGAALLDSIPVDYFQGSAVVLDVSEYLGMEIPVLFLEQQEPSIETCDYLLLRCGWDRFWGSDDYFRDFPVLSSEAAIWLAGKNLKGLGLDCISADMIDNPTLPIHRILLGGGMVIIENLRSLQSLPVNGEGLLHFLALPLRIKDSDGSPVRALAEIRA